MASSSSDSVSFHQPKHEVFLSFRGEDTRNNFLYHLYEAFRRKGVGAYADFKELSRGEEISHTLWQAIEESMVSTIVFSQNYATSSWCLEELSKIMECRRSWGQLVVPIFYHVNPSDIQNQTGSFGKAFVEHERSKKDKVQGWKYALTEAGNLSGWSLSGDKPEPIVIEEIVHDILNKLNRLSKRDYKGFIGIGPPMEQIKSLLCVGGDQAVRIIGIWGMGGIGKTTLAQVVYDEVSTQFESCYFLANVREQSERHGVISLRDKLLSILLNEDNLHICTPLIGSTFIKDRLRRKRLLVVLDDVNDFDQLEKLAISHDHFGFGSRIIVTSRDKQVLTNGSIDGIHEVKELSYNDSLQLFSLFAFKQNQPVDNFKDLSNSFLEYTKGVPLALTVLGSTLYRQSMAYWESALNRLKQCPNRKIQSVLQISFDALDEVEKNMFLDIACFFKGYVTYNVTKILEGCYGSIDCGITNLIDKCLLNDDLGMHDLLQEMGRNVVLAESPYPEKRSRLWTRDDVRIVLENGRGTKIQGMLLDQSQIGEIQLHPGAFARMHRLRIIKFYGKGGKLVPLDPGLESLPNELRCFHWENCMLKSLPSKFHPEKLVELRLPHSEVEQLWNAKLNLVNLRVFDLKRCKNLTGIPDLSTAINIEKLSIEGCKSLVELPSMIHLKYLSDSIILHGCNNLKKFPELPQHIKLLVGFNTAIEEIPDSIENLNQLKHLVLNRSRVKAVSKNIYKLESLETFELVECQIFLLPEVPRNFKRSDLHGHQIEERPSSIGCHNQLSCLNMRGSQIRNLPSTIAQLDALKDIRLSDCPNITEFPNLPENLRRLGLENTAIKEVPSSISRLKSLAYLHLDDNRKLKSLPTGIFELTSLKELYLSGSAIEEVPSSISGLISLAHWIMEGCTKLKSLPKSICKLISLEKLNLNGCSNLEYFPEILETMECLSYLDLSGTAIEEVHSSISELKSLAHWRMKGCTKLKSLPKSICKLKSLETLNLNGCSNLECFPEILETMGCLIYLYLKRTGIKVSRSWNIFELGNLVFLKELRLTGSDIVEIPEGIKQHSNLICLYLTCCKSLKSLPELPPCLRYLIAQGCTSLERVSKSCSKKIKPEFSKQDLESKRLWYENSADNYFLFNNCFNLDQDAVNNIVASTQLKIQSMVEEFDVELYNRGYEIYDQGVFSCFPGSEIPKTFENRSTNSSITVQLSPACSSRRFLGFVLCIVVDFKHHQEGCLRVDYKFRLKTECGVHHKFGSSQPWRMEECKGIESNHVIVLFHAFQSGIVETSRDNHFDEASFDFSVDVSESVDSKWKRIEVQKCGVNVLYVDAVRSNDEEDELSTIYWADGEDEVVESNETLEPCCDANSSFIQDEENRCDASISEPNFALGPNRLSLNCDVNNRDLEGSMMEEDANDEEGLGYDPSSSIARYFLCCFRVS